MVPAASTTSPTSGSSSLAAAIAASASTMPSGTGPSKTRMCFTFGTSSRIFSNRPAYSASTNTTVASELSVT